MDQTTKQILECFYALSAVPRPSGGEGAAAEFLAGQLRQAGLTSQMDDSYNLRCLLPASRGFEHAPGVILQAHTDMVCVAAPNGGWRPGLDGVTVKLEDGFVRSDGRSSLGADNGLGVALMLWLARNPQLPHPRILLLFTACEERGLVGAKALNPQWLEGFQYYINLDAFRGDAAIIASAGGLRQSWSHPLRRQKISRRPTFEVTLSGLTGGHSGFDIHRGRLNALTALADFLTKCPGLAANCSGGSDFNAIPTLARAQIATDRPEELSRAVEDWLCSLRSAHQSTDPNLAVTLKECTPVDSVWEPDTCREVLTFLKQLPQGVLEWRSDCPDTPALSGNPAVLRETEGQLEVLHFTRCAHRAGLAHTEEQTGRAAQTNGFTRTLGAGYAPWEGSADNPLVRRIQTLYLRQNGKELEPVALHVGLESSLILDKSPTLTGVGLGFDILDAHSVTERAKLDSIPRLARLICGLLEELNEEESHL